MKYLTLIAPLTRERLSELKEQGISQRKEHKREQLEGRMRQICLCHKYKGNIKV